MSPSATAPQISWTQFTNIIDGKPRSSDKTYHGINPCTRESLWETPAATPADVNDAVAAARAAFPAWAATPHSERSSALKAFAQCAFVDNAPELGKLLGIEAGKTKSGTDIELRGAYGQCMFNADVELKDEVTEDHQKIMVTKYVPLGVVAAIVPWNFPIVLSIVKIASAVITGNCIIVKPSPYTPYTALKMVEIAQGFFPEGVVQVVGGGDDIGPALVGHEGIDKISFTGSGRTGKRILEGAGDVGVTGLKRVTLEMGGNDAAIVCADVDIPETAMRVAMGGFFHTGQVCGAIKRVYVDEKIYPQFVEEAVKVVEGWKVGNVLDEGVMLGPLQNEMQFNKVSAMFEEGKKEGWKFATGIDGLSKTSKLNGYFIKPAIIDNPPEDSKIMQEEQFGTSAPLSLS